MNKQIKDFNELRSNAADYLEQKLFYASRTVDDHRKCWKLIRNFMYKNGIMCYNRDVGRHFLDHMIKDRSITKLGAFYE